jgi:transcriptional regulator with XRE-family HTH domain
MMLPGLKYERHAAGLTQEELAEKSGVGRDTIQKLETGHRPARPATIKKLAETLGVDARQLMSGT